MTTRTALFAVTAAMEVGAGLVLLVAPALAIGLLFGDSANQTAVAVGRLAGIALTAIGTACWWARRDVASAASRGLVCGLLLYNAGVAVLVLSGGLGPTTPLLWAAVVAHTVMAVWCGTSLRAAPVRMP
jgi:hypothetical protein